MTWLTVAKKDFRDAVQSRALWALVVVFVILSVLSTYAYAEAPELFGEPGGADFDGLLLFTAGFTGLFVPIAGIVVCYKSLAGERELGQIKLLLSMPTNRRAVFAGKVIGRSAVLIAGLGVGLLVGLAFGAILLGGLPLLGAAGFVLATVVFAVVYASIFVGLSATTGSTSRATTLALGFFVVFELLWDIVPMGVVYVLEGFSPPAEFPDWVFLVAQLSPSGAYFSTVLALVPGLSGDAEAAPEAGGGVEAAGAEAFYVTPEVGLVALAFWFVVALVVGYRSFDRADL